MSYALHSVVLKQVRCVEHRIDSHLWMKSSHLDLSGENLEGWPAFHPWFSSIDLSDNKFRSIPVFTPTPKGDLVGIFRPLRSVFLRCNKIRRVEEGDLPESLEILDLSRNQITEITWLPPGLKELTLDNNNIKILCALPPGLKKLSISHNPLEVLPILPLTLKSLTVTFTSLKALPVLPPGLTHLECNNNQLESLPTLPPTLVTLSAGKNLLKDLPVMPEGLLLLSVPYNQLTKLTPPSTVTDLDANTNQIAWISQIPLGSLKVDLSRNRLKALPAIADCGALTNLKCCKNRLETLPTPPPQLAGMDDFRFEFYGNPFGYIPNPEATVGDFVEFLHEKERERSYERTALRTGAFKEQLCKIAACKVGGRYVS